jgi:hypothetical protein
VIANTQTMRTCSRTGELEVLSALRVHADALTLRANDAAEWACVILANAQYDFTASDTPPRSFDCIVNSLVERGLYKPIDEDRGWVKMNG